MFLNLITYIPIAKSQHSITQTVTMYGTMETVFVTHKTIKLIVNTEYVGIAIIPNMVKPYLLTKYNTIPINTKQESVIISMFNGSNTFYPPLIDIIEITLR